MAHFAKLGINSKVIAVHVIADSKCLNADGVEDEEVGRQYLENLFHWPLWKKTSYNSYGNTHSSGDNSKAVRKNFAGVGMTYDEDRDAFIPKKLHASWTFNESTCQYEAPTPEPAQTAEDLEKGIRYRWDEPSESWVKNS